MSGYLLLHHSRWKDGTLVHRGRDIQCYKEYVLRLSTHSPSLNALLSSAVNFGDNYGGNAPSPGFQVTYVQPFLGPSVSEATCISSNIGMAAFEYESAPNGDINPAGSFCYTLESSLGVAVGSEIAVTPQPFQLITLTDEQTLNGERFWRMYLKNLACTSDDYRTLGEPCASRISSNSDRSRFSSHY